MSVKKMFIELSGSMLLIVAFAALMSFVTSHESFGSGVSGDTPASPGKTVYQCPMKCEGEKTYLSPGKCPVCKMSLTAVAIKNVASVTESKSEINEVHIVGAMKNVMHKGELSGNIALDTISERLHLYGLGPVEYLTGEILIDDGKSYVSTVTADESKMHIEETYQTKAPFFVYANVGSWTETMLPDSITSIQELERYLEATTSNAQRPFAFKVIGVAEKASIHVANLPKGSEVHSPDDVLKALKRFAIENEKVEMVGMFSTEHAGVFTHHDSFVHIHLITADGSKMGHLDSLSLKKGTAMLYLPK